MNKLQTILQTIKEGLFTKRQDTNIEEEVFSIIDVIDESLEDAKGYARQQEVDDFEEFNETTTYSIGDIVRKDGLLYKFTANKNAGVWDSTKVSQTNIVSIIQGITGVLSNLTTTAKNNLVSAINEMNGGTIGIISDVIDDSKIGVDIGWQ